jgi:hypothetical protein
MMQESIKKRQDMLAAIKKGTNSKKWPDADWLESVGFVMSETKMSHDATITICSFDGVCGKAKVVLRMSCHKVAPDEWVTDVISYNERGKEENSVGLVNSWLKTRGEVVRLCKALGVESWKDK